MHLLPYVVAYFAIAVIIIAVIARIIMWTRMPIHVRWELYPVAHEGKKAHYGGSYLEELNWWEKPREVSLLGELKVMIPEILFLVALKEHNPKLWIRSFPFHFGLYLLIAWVVLMSGVGIVTNFWPFLLPEEFLTVVSGAILVLGVAGLILSAFGALGLLQRRLFDSDLKDFSSKADIFNLVFFVITFGVTLVSFALVDNDFFQMSYFLQNLLTFQMYPIQGEGLEVLLPTASIIFGSLLAAYIPLTHMSHFIGKYFAYHAIRWNDTPNLKGGKEEGAIHKVLSQPVTWSASHIRADGKKTWVDVATDINMEGE